MENRQIAVRVSTVTILINLILFAFKLIAGITAGSAAMVSDAVHTASDILSTIIVLIGVKMAGKEADREHPYGHERLECVAAIILAVLLCATGAGIGYGGFLKIISGDYDAMTVPGLPAAAAALVSIAAKEAMYWYTRAAAMKIQSGALLADAWHHRSDALSSVGSFVGVLGARIGFPVMDAVASVVICVFIVKAAIQIFLEAIRKMTDVACDGSIEEEIRSLILAQEGVLGIDTLKTRMFGDKIYIDIEIQADGGATLHRAHGIAEKVHDAIEAGFPRVKHCMVHVNPADEEE